MKKQILIYASILAGTFGIQSCSSDDDASVDTQKPVIVLNEPTNEQVFHAGEEIHVDADFSDNVGLASYKIEIHSAGDGHTHDKNANAEGEWFYTDTNSIEGNPKNYTAHKNILVPHTVNGAEIAEGHYHLGIFSVDTSGNEQQLFIEIEIHHEH